MIIYTQMNLLLIISLLAKDYNVYSLMFKKRYERLTFVFQQAFIHPTMIVVRETRTMDWGSRTK